MLEEKKELSLNESLNSIIDVEIDTLDNMLNCLSDNEIMECIPIVKIAAGILKIHDSVKEKNKLRQTAEFLKQFKSGTIDCEKLKKMQEKINKGDKKAKEEIERIILLLNDFKDTFRSAMLGNLCRCYVNGTITYNLFYELTEVIERIQLSDIHFLKQINEGIIKDTVNWSYVPFNRLKSLGLIDTCPKGLYPIDPDDGYVRNEEMVSISPTGGHFCVFALDGINYNE